MSLLRLCEWGRVRADGDVWDASRRSALQEAVELWRQNHRLNAAPLFWGGLDGLTLHARNWVGVVEIEGQRVEILPKTEKSLLQKDEPSESEANAALSDFLRLVEAAEFDDWVEADNAALGAEELAFPDVWAFLLGKNLWRELRRGLPQSYLNREDDLPTVRGRILVGAQLARFGERIDRTVCAWDEFSPDTPLLRVFKAACRVLRRLATHPAAQGFLGDCLLVLDEVSDVSPREALRGAERLVWTRATQRFRPAFGVAKTILEGDGPQLGAGSQATWVFLSDMNRVFEAFVRAALEDDGKRVREQETVGFLLESPKRQKQIADFVWQSDKTRWIGDAKWKALAGEISEDENAEPTKLSLVPADIRQLTVYAELQKQDDLRPELAIFYPNLSGETTRTFQTWNATQLHLVPIKVRNWTRPREALGGFTP